MYINKEYELAKHLYEEAVTPKMEYLKKKNEYETVLAQIAFFKREMVNSWQSESTNLELKNADLISRIKQLEEEKEAYCITSPIKGVIYQTKGIQSGSHITTGQVLAHISPDEDLIAECYVSPSDIGFLKENQKVSFQLDAYNYNQWGLVEGKVLNISDDIVEVDNNPVFKVRCDLSRKFLTLKSGHKGRIKKGMTLTGRFYLNKRSLFELLYDKMDNWLNPKIKE